MQVQLAQVRDASIRAISKLPEPLDKAIQLHEAALRRHLGKREIDQPESELRMEDAAAENRQRDDNARAWVKFRNDVCRIVDKAIANGSRQWVMRTLFHVIITIDLHLLRLGLHIKHRDIENNNRGIFGCYETYL